MGKPGRKPVEYNAQLLHLFRILHVEYDWTPSQIANIYDLDPGYLISRMYPDAQPHERSLFRKRVTQTTRNQILEAYLLDPTKPVSYLAQQFHVSEKTVRLVIQHVKHSLE